MRKILKRKFEKKIHVFRVKNCVKLCNFVKFRQKMHNFRGGLYKFRDILQFYNSFRVLGPCYTMWDHFMSKMPVEIRNPPQISRKMHKLHTRGVSKFANFWEGCVKFRDILQTPPRNYMKFRQILQNSAQNLQKCRHVRFFFGENFFQ